MEFNINNIVHPSYQERSSSWDKWRRAYEGGDSFVDTYLKQYIKGETNEEFQRRKEISCSPCFAKTAIIEVRNSIYQRLSDIVRLGGSKTWQDAINGKSGGVDKLGSSMNTFMGVEILEELLVMGKVGIYIDMPAINQDEVLTLANKGSRRPYLYYYRTEDIRSWADDDTSDVNTYRALLLRDTVYENDAVLGLPAGHVTRYRYYWKDENNQIWVQFYSANSVPDGPPIKLSISRIPFVCLELNNSLMADIANHQIALLNLASSDMAYAIGANFPLYVEPYDPIFDHMKSNTQQAVLDHRTGKVIESPTPANDTHTTIQVGPTSGRRYPKDSEAPSFIHPSSDPMIASMAKQDQIKLEIRLLLNLTIANIQAKMASAESKGMDTRTLESGLSYIGLIMEDGERQIVSFWQEYERDLNTDVGIKYPEKYSLRNQEEVYKEVDQLKAKMAAVPSITYKRVIAKRIADLLLGHLVTIDLLIKVHKEIDQAKVIDVLIDKIEIDVTNGTLSKSLAAELRGYPEGDIEVAQEEEAKRLERIQKSQAPGQGTGAVAIDNPAARGVPDKSINPAEDAKKEKQQNAA